MNQSEMKKFQVIGRYAAMQTLSLEDELRLLDGVPYDIDFSQGRFVEIPAGATLGDVPVYSIVGAILFPPKAPALPATTSPDWDWDEVDRQAKKDAAEEKRRAKKWRKKHPKRSPKKAYKDLCKQMKRLGVRLK